MEIRSLAIRLALLTGCALAAPIQAQQRVSLQPRLETRLDAVLSPSVGLLGGIGVNLRAGWYARLGVTASAGVVARGDTWEGLQRLDATARFLFDPFGESARGIYGGAGLGLRYDGGRDARGELLVLLGVEGRPTGRVVPAVEVTLGGGVRVGVVLRGRRPTGR